MLITFNNSFFSKIYHDNIKNQAVKSVKVKF